MMRSRKLAVVAMVLGSTFAGGASRADEACSAALRTAVQPVFNANCVACHQDAAPAGGLSLQRTSAFASLLGIPSQQSKLARVRPGDPQKSYLFRKIAGTHLEAGGSGARMPSGGRLTDSEIKGIGDWIAGCAAR